jgi:hypothetical protein
MNVRRQGIFYEVARHSLGGRNPDLSGFLKPSPFENSGKTTISCPPASHPGKVFPTTVTLK